MSKWLKYWPFYSVFLAWLAIFATNVRLDGSYLMGWDNFMPELDFKLNVWRSLNAVWQEYRGLGVTDGMAQAADLSRQLFLWLLSAVIPTWFLRQLWLWLMLLLGGLGACLMGSWMARTSGLKLVRKEAGWVGILSGFGYVFNLGMVQYFFTPFEPFLSFYGFLPWFLWSWLKYLHKPDRKALALLLAIQILGASAFSVQTLFIVWVVLALISGGIVGGVKGVKTLLTGMMLMLLVHAFWLLPVLYFALTQANVVADAASNVLATGDMLMLNKAYGTIPNIVRLIGFPLDYTDLNQGNAFGFVMDAWQDQVRLPFVSLLGYGVFVFTLVGAGVVLVKSPRLRWYPILLLLVLFLLTAGYGPFGAVFSLLQQNIPFFGQLFRAVHTKWSIVGSFVYALGMGVGVVVIANFFVYWMKGWGVRLMGMLMLAWLMVYCWPLFEGKLISPNLYVSPPKAYSKLYEFMDGQDHTGRVALAPFFNHWGWEYHDWGYRGSGFLWFGIPQPLLTRAFDVWSRHNETFYNQISWQVYRGTAEGMMNVFEQYDVTYVLIDESIYEPGSEPSALRFNWLKQSLAAGGAKEIFVQDFLSVYELPSKNGSFGDIEVPPQFTVVEGDVTYSVTDPIYSEHGVFIELMKAKSQLNNILTYPLIGLLKQRSLEWSIEEDNILRVGHFSTDVPDGELITPPYKGEWPLIAHIEKHGTTLMVEWEAGIQFEQGHTRWNLPTIEPILISVPDASQPHYISLSDRVMELPVSAESISVPLLVDLSQPLEVSFYSGDSEAIEVDLQLTHAQVHTCWTRTGAEGKVGYSRDDTKFALSATDASACLPIYLGELDSGLMRVEIPYSVEGIKSSVRYCVTSTQAPGECLNEQFNIASLDAVKSQNGALEEEILLKEASGYWIDLIARAGGDKGASVQVDYEMPEIAHHALISSLLIPLNIAQETIDLRQGKVDVRVTSLPHNVIGDLVDSEAVNNCDVFDRGEVSIDAGPERLVYSAANWGVACNSIEIPIEYLNSDQLLRFKTTTLSGRPMRLYAKLGSNWTVTEQVTQADGENVYGLLAGQKPLDTVILTTEVKAFADLSAETSIDDAELIPIPLQWLSGIAVLNANGELKQPNSILINGATKKGTGLYSVRVHESGAGNENSIGLFQLAQGYEDGWMAIQNGTILEHVKVNGWANGWLTDSNEELKVYYWPQYLEWVGMGGLLGYVVLTGSRLIKVKNK